MRLLSAPMNSRIEVGNRNFFFSFRLVLKFNSFRLKSTIDSSHLITFSISILVILYASFRSLNSELDSLSEDENNSCLLDKNTVIVIDENDEKKDKYQTINTFQALFIPFLSSVSLLFMFFYFDFFQTTFVICTSGKIFNLF